MKTKWMLACSTALCLIVTGCNPAPESGGHSARTEPIDLDAELARAKTANKLLFLDFTGSDWCPPCMQLEKQVFSQPEFQRYAEDNLVFVVVDFPRKTKLPGDVQEANNRLAEQFNVEAFPTLVVLDGNGTEVWRNVGFPDGGLSGLIATLDKLKPKSDAPVASQAFHSSTAGLSAGGSGSTAVLH
jgi:thioredoxin-related protein